MDYARFVVSVKHPGPHGRAYAARRFFHSARRAQLAARLAALAYPPAAVEVYAL